MTPMRERVIRSLMCAGAALIFAAAADWLLDHRHGALGLLSSLLALKWFTLSAGCLAGWLED